MMMKVKRETRKREKNNLSLREGHIRTVRGGRLDGSN